MDYARDMKYLGLLIVLAMSVNTNGQIYRSVDKHGNPVFSDVPTEGAEEIELTEPTEVESLDVAPLPPLATQSQDQADMPFKYESLVITAPEDDQAVRDNAGNVTITALIKPGLKQGHTAVLYLDGKEHSTNQGLTFALSQLDRGTHTARISIRDENGKLLISSKTVTFHLLRHSVLHKTGTTKTSPG